MNKRGGVHIFVMSYILRPGLDQSRTSEVRLASSMTEKLYAYRIYLHVNNKEVDICSYRMYQLAVICTYRYQCAVICTYV